MPGVDGIKTGYTNAAGFTLAASAMRDGKRLIAVVLGGPSTMARDQNVAALLDAGFDRSEEHTSELQSLMRISYAVFCLKKKTTKNIQTKMYNATHTTH